MSKGAIERENLGDQCGVSSCFQGYGAEEKAGFRPFSLRCDRYIAFTAVSVTGITHPPRNRCCSPFLFPSSAYCSTWNTRTDGGRLGGVWFSKLITGRPSVDTSKNIRPLGPVCDDRSIQGAQKPFFARYRNPFFTKPNAQEARANPQIV